VSVVVWVLKAVTWIVVGIGYILLSVFLLEVFASV